MRAGRLRHRVTIREFQQTQDPTSGEMVSAWVEVATVWAHVEPLSVRDFVAAGAAQSEVSARITIRYRDDLTAAMRIEHRGKTYAIAGVLPDKASGLEYITLPVSEVTI